MQQSGLPVSPFKAVGMPLLSAFEQQPIPLDVLKTYIPDIDSRGQSTLSLGQIKKMIGQFPDDQEKRKSWLEGLHCLITSDDFFYQITALAEAVAIRSLYRQLRQSHMASAFIVRSSGIF